VVLIEAGAILNFNAIKDVCAPKINHLELGMFKVLLLKMRNLNAARHYFALAILLSMVFKIYLDLIGTLYQIVRKVRYPTEKFLFISLLDKHVSMI